MKLNIIIIFSLIINLNACKKAELKKPTTLNIQFAINSDLSDFNGVKFKSADLTLQTFTIVGERLKGDNINFDRILDTPLNIVLNHSINIDELRFDIPQGDYTELIVKFNGLKSSYTGKYKPTNGATVDIIFEIENNHHFLMVCEENNQTDLINLDKNIDKTICVILNPKNWFDYLTIAQLDNADLINGNNGNGQGNSTLLINASNNITIYNTILNHISLGNKASFK